MECGVVLACSAVDGWGPLWKSGREFLSCPCGHGVAELEFHCGDVRSELICDSQWLCGGRRFALFVAFAGGWVPDQDAMRCVHK